MRRILIAVFLLTATAIAQTTPTLHSRDKAEPQTQTPEVKGYSTLPDSASGEYVLDSHGSVVQITIEHNRLTGYVTRMDSETALTLFFDKASIEGNKVTFTTKTVHGLRYEFRGAIVRGDEAEPSLNGYFLLAGKMTMYRGATPEPAQVRLKSTPRLP